MGKSLGYSIYIYSFLQPGFPQWVTLRLVSKSWNQSCQSKDCTNHIRFTVTRGEPEIPKFIRHLQLARGGSIANRDLSQLQSLIIHGVADDRVRPLISSCTALKTLGIETYNRDFVEAIARMQSLTSLHISGNVGLKYHFNNLRLTTLKISEPRSWDFNYSFDASHLVKFGVNGLSHDNLSKLFKDTSFPKLEKLSLQHWGYGVQGFFPLLPKTITSLTIREACDVESLQGLSHLKLETLNLNRCQLADWSSFACLTHLKTLKCSHLQFLPRMPSLTSLYCYYDYSPAKLENYAATLPGLRFLSWHVVYGNVDVIAKTSPTIATLLKLLPNLRVRLINHHSQEALLQNK